MFLSGKMRRLIIIGLLIAISGHAIAQAQEFQKAELIEGPINSEGEEFNPRISPDGQTLYFTKTYSEENVGGKLAGQDIWFSKRVGVSWDTPENLKTLNNRDDNAIVGINNDGNRLFLINNYSAYPKRYLGLVSSEKVKGKKGWSRPKELPVEVKTPEKLYGFYVSPNEDIIVISMDGEESLGAEDLYVCLKEGDEWSKPIHLGNKINSTEYEFAPFLSKDRKTLYFSSTGFDGLGEADIYASHRLDSGWTNWSLPENLGPNINSDKFDAYFVLSDQGKAYFSSNRLGELSTLYTAERVKSIEVKPIAQKKAYKVSYFEKKDKAGKLIDITNLKNQRVSSDHLDDVAEHQVVYFDSNSTELTTNTRRTLQKVIKTMKEQGNVTLEIIGHADERGDEEYNNKLSRKRASTVHEYLFLYKVSSSRMKVSYFGESKLSSDGEVDALQWDRRVELIFKKVASDN